MYIPIACPRKPDSSIGLTSLNLGGRVRGAGELKPFAAVCGPVCGAEVFVEPDPATPLSSLSQTSKTLRTRLKTIDRIPSCCPICQEELEVTNAEAFKCRTHFYCTECVEHYISGRLDENRVPLCPEPGCDCHLDATVAQRVLDSVHFDKFLVLNLRANPRMKACPECDKTLYVHDVENSEKYGLRCAFCHHIFCTKCQCMMHLDESCAQAAAKARLRRGREVSVTFKKLCRDFGFKECPQCLAVVEKEDPETCDHMTCVQCRHEFCWSCLADRSVIYAHGNHYHHPDCRFFSEYSGSSEYIPDRCVMCKRTGWACQRPRKVTYL